MQTPESTAARSPPAAEFANPFTCGSEPSKSSVSSSPRLVSVQTIFRTFCLCPSWSRYCTSRQTPSGSERSRRRRPAATWSMPRRITVSSTCRADVVGDLEQPGAADLVGDQLAAQVQFGQRLPDLGHDQLDDVLPDLAALDDLGRRQAQPLVEHRLGVHVESARLAAADVQPVPGGADPGPQLAGVVHRGDGGDIRLVGGAQVRVVADQHVPGVDPRVRDRVRTTASRSGSARAPGW